MHKIKKVSIIIISHNNKDILPKALESIKNQNFKDLEIYLVDNDSDDGTERFIKQNYPEVNFMKGTQNVSKKRNTAIFKSNSKYIITLDSDAILNKNWIKKAVKYMDEHENVGICGGKLITEDGLVDFAGGIISKNGGSGDRGFRKKDCPEYNNFKRVSFIKSAVLIMRRKLIKDIGGFDEDYIYGYEDADLGLRANICGWKVVYNPDLVAIHLSHSTISKISKKIVDFDYLTRRNRFFMLLKNFEFRTLLLNFPIIFITFLYSFSKKKPLKTLKGYLWIFGNFNKIKKSRREVFKKRRISDKKLFDEIFFPTFLRNNKQNYLISYMRKLNNYSLKHLTFFITAKCNSKCKHCFYWKDLNKKRDLSLKEISKILSNFYNIDYMALTGGEPFMRKDLDEIIKLVIKYTDVKMIQITTNCILDVADKFENILKENPKTIFLIVCSLDGLKKEHEHIRGVKGNFEKTVKLIKKFGELRKKYPNFQDIVVNTVITDYNYKTFPKLINFVKTLPVDNHAFEIIRGGHQGIFSIPNIKNLKKINKLREEAAKYYLRKKPFLKKIFNNLKNKRFLKTQISVLNGGKWKFKCVAGLTDLTIESDGTARICELQPKIGDLLKNTPEKLLKSDKAKIILNKIKNHQCDCTHICNLSTSINHSFFRWFF